MLIPHSRRKRMKQPMATVVGMMVAILTGVFVSTRQHRERDLAAAAGDSLALAQQHTQSTIQIAVGVTIGLLALAVVVIAFIRRQNTQY